MSRTVILVFLILALIVGIALLVYSLRSRNPAPDVEGGIQLISAFVEGGNIPEKYTCDGEDVSPSLAWSGVPEGAVSLALVVRDPDAPGGDYVHWVIFNIPAILTGLAEAAEMTGEIPGVGVQGINDFGTVGYGGPCPPEGDTHNYVFSLYALDQQLELGPGASLAELEAAMQGHILDDGKLSGVYRR